MTRNDAQSNRRPTEDTEERDDTEVKDLELSEATAEQVRGGGTRQEGSYMNHNEVQATSPSARQTS